MKGENNVGEEVRANGHGQEPMQIIPATNGALAKPEESVEQRIARAERQIQYRKGILKLIAANIEPEDIAIYGEGEKANIHLTKTACKQILSWAGITVQPDNAIQEKRYEGQEGPYIDFEVWATWFTPDGRYYRSMGNRATYDDFFAKRSRYTCAECGAEVRWDNRQAICRRDNKKVSWKKDDYYLPLTEVDIPAVKQAAITNLWNHIVEDAGLRPAKRELEAVGFDFSKVGQRVEFGGERKETAKKAPAAANAAQSPSGQGTGSGAAATARAQAPAASPSNPKAGTQPPKAEIPKEPLGATGSGSRGTALNGSDKPRVAEKPSDSSTIILSGVITAAYLNETKTGKNAGSKYVRMSLLQDNGAGEATLFCFHNHDVVTCDGDVNLLNLLVDSRSKRAEIIVRQSAKGYAIEGAKRIGLYYWEDGGSVGQRV